MKLVFEEPVLLDLISTCGNWLHVAFRICECRQLWVISDLVREDFPVFKDVSTFKHKFISSNFTDTRRLV